MRKKLFIGICLLQLITVLFIFTKHEYVKKTGTRYKLEVTVYDPYDIFRGNYVRLDLTQNFVKTSSDDSLQDQNNYSKNGKYIKNRKNAKVYLVLSDEMPSKIIDITEKKPKKDYIKGNLWNPYGKEEGYYFRTDLKRYYGTPKRSLEAEKKLRENKKAYINIYVSGDTVIIDSLEIGKEVF